MGEFPFSLLDHFYVSFESHFMSLRDAFLSSLSPSISCPVLLSSYSHSFNDILVSVL